jgi:hypothetical protein
MVDGIVGWEPLLVLQCRECGITHEGTRGGQDVRGADIILAGYMFHTCEGREGIRRCPGCHAKVIAACPNTGRHR